MPPAQHRPRVIRPRTRALAALAAAAAIAAVGCGGGSDSELDGEGPALSKRELIAQGDTICSRTFQRLSTALQTRFEIVGADLNREQQEDFFAGEGADILSDQLEELRSLVPPEADRDAYQGLLDELSNGIEIFRSDPGSVLDGENTSDAPQKASEFGFRVCAQSQG